MFFRTPEDNLGDDMHRVVECAVIKLNHDQHARLRLGNTVVLAALCIMWMFWVRGQHTECSGHAIRP